MASRAEQEAGSPAPQAQEIEEVRLAMALNGGVSLAVWMGGCAVELDCARRAHWGPEDEAFDAVMGGAKRSENREDRDVPRSLRTTYNALCSAFRRELVIDIMSGASAGGVNGGLLAGAMVWGRRLHPAYVREQWLRLGDFSKLLHSPTDPTPRSLLQGQHFIDSLLGVFKDLAKDDAEAMSLGLVVPHSQSQHPEPSVPQLDVTVTDVRGTERTYRDNWGGTFSAREYRRRFSFRELPDFTPGNLADAARCSASFPVAFEPFQADTDSWKLTDRPDLEPSREGPPWTIDGGLLDNAPIRAAIELIPARPANRQVKRYLVYVNPESHGTLEPGSGAVGTNADGQAPSDEPELADVAGYVVNLPRKLPFVDQLDAIEDAVQKSSLVADGALDLLAEPLETVEGVARALLPAYASRRTLKSLQELLGDSAAAERACLTLADTRAGLPWIPRKIGLDDPVQWDWGLSTAIRVCHFLLDLIRLGIAQGRDQKLFLDARAHLDKRLGELHTAYRGTQHRQKLIRELRSPQFKLSSPERVAGLQGLAGDAQAAALPAVRSAICIFANLLRALDGELTFPRALRDCDRVGEAEVDVGAALLGGGWREDAALRDVCDKDPRKRAKAPLTGPEQNCLRRLLAIEVIRRAYTAEEPVNSAQELSFVQLTPDAATPLFSPDPLDAPFDASAESKLTGIRLGHFAGFLKRSWRANDFMWGRLDAAARIVDLLVDPARAAELGEEGVAQKLAEAMMGDEATLEQRWLVAEVLDNAVDEGAKDPPEPNQLRPLLQNRLAEDLSTADAFFTRTICTRAAQLEIARAELPEIAKATRTDAEDGSATREFDFGEVERRTGGLSHGGVLREAIVNVRSGKPLPVRLGRDDPAETTSDLTARTAARAGFVSLAALRTAKLPAARALDFLRPPLLAVTGMSARGWWRRIPLVLGFWAAALYLTARIVNTSGPADLGLISLNDLLLALVAVLTVIGVAVLPFVRGLRRRWEPAAFGEFAGALSIVVVGGGTAIALALAFGDLSPAQLVVGNGSDALPDWVLDLALAVALGLPLARTTLLRRAPNWMLNLSKQGAVSAALLAAVAILVGAWTGKDLTDGIDAGPAWRTIAALIAVLPPIVCTIYLWVHKKS